MYYKIGKFDKVTNQIKITDGRAYDYGKTPSFALNPKSQVLLEVHSSQNDYGLWYTAGCIFDNEPLFDLTVQAKYTEGVTPCLGLVRSNESGSVSEFLEIHTSQHNSALWYNVLKVHQNEADEITVEPMTNAKVNDGHADLQGLNPVLVEIPASDSAIVIYTDVEAHLAYTIAKITGTDIEFSK